MMYVTLFRAALSGVILLAGAFASQAQQPEWRKFVSAAHDGYVMQFSYPPEWTVRESALSGVTITLEGLETEGLETDIPGISATANIRMEWGSVDWDKTTTMLHYPLPGSITVDEISPSIMTALQSGDVSSAQLSEIIKVDYSCGWLGPNGCVEFLRESVRLSSGDGVLIQYSRPELFDFAKKKMVKTIEPSELSAYFATFNGNTALQIHVTFSLVLPDGLWPADGKPGPHVYNLFHYRDANTSLIPFYRQVLPDVLELIRTAKFLTPSELDPALAVTTIYESERVQISRRRDYSASGKFWISVPGDWDIKEIEVLQADPNYEAGSMTVRFTAPAEKSTVGCSEALYITLRGMPVRSLVPEEFLATADDWAKIFSAEYQLLDSRKIDLNGMGFAKLRSTFITGTGDTQVNTYSGVDTDGNPIKYTIYTAGAQTMVANIIFLADEADHDKLLPEIEDMLSSLRVDFFAPGAFQ